MYNLLNSLGLSNPNKLSKLKIGWILLGNENIGSSRIHGINIHNFLLKNRIKSIILQSNKVMNSNLTIPFLKQLVLLNSGYDIFIFQKVFDEKAIGFVKLAKMRGIKTIFVQSDKIDTEMIKLCDYLIVTSKYLKQYYDSIYGTNCIVIEDAIEADKKYIKNHSEKNKIEVVWVGHSDNWKTLEIIHDVFEKLNDKSFYLKRISDHPRAEVRWDLNTIYEEILTADIGVIPAMMNGWGKAKSNNRLTMFMALGLPVIATPIPAYQDIIEHGSNGFLSENIDDWIRYLLFLKDTTIRKNIGMKARQDVLKKYSIDVIGNQWVSLIDQIK